MHEAKLMVRLQHRNVLKLYSVYETDEYVHLVLELYVCLVGIRIFSREGEEEACLFIYIYRGRRKSWFRESLFEKLFRVVV